MSRRHLTLGITQFDCIESSINLTTLSPFDERRGTHDFSSIDSQGERDRSELFPKTSSVLLLCLFSLLSTLLHFIFHLCQERDPTCYFTPREGLHCTARRRKSPSLGHFSVRLVLLGSWRRRKVTGCRL